MNVAMFLLFDEEERERRENVFEFQRLKLQRQHLRDASNPFTLPSHYFRQLYRMPPALALQLIDVLELHIAAQGSSYIPVHLQVLAVLRFLAEGAYQKGVSQDYKHPLGRTTFSRILQRVVTALHLIANEWIKFPRTREDRERVKNQFLQHYRIPGILGLIDCTVVKMVRPSVNEEAFYNHKHSHSMNVQVVADDSYIIQSVRICPGSNNDRFTWKFSAIKQTLQSLRNDQDIIRNEGFYYFLGDSGYTPSPIMLTPIRNAPEGSPEAQYTDEHVRTRCKIEQLFGVLSNVWLAISRRRTLHYSPRKVALIIEACCVLHNFRRYHGIIDDVPEYENINNNEVGIQEGDYIAGIEERQRLIRLHYN